MEEFEAILAVIDISGYTDFIVKGGLPLAHAELIITGLLESVLDKAEYPLELHKFEGDAALLFTPVKANERVAIANDIFTQIGSVFSEFDRKQREMIAQSGGGCPCEACTKMHDLDIKAFLHLGAVLHKKMRGKEELAGLPLILVHRMMKNSLDASRYVLMSEAYKQALGTSPKQAFQALEEDFQGLGKQHLFAWLPEYKPVEPDPRPRGTRFMPMLFMQIIGMKTLLLHKFGKAAFNIRFVAKPDKTATPSPESSRSSEG